MCVCVSRVEMRQYEWENSLQFDTLLPSHVNIKFSTCSDVDSCCCCCRIFFLLVRWGLSNIKSFTIAFNYIFVMGGKHTISHCQTNNNSLEKSPTKNRLVQFHLVFSLALFLAREIIIINERQQERKKKKKTKSWHRS